MFWIESTYALNGGSLTSWLCVMILGILHTLMLEVAPLATLHAWDVNLHMGKFNLFTFFPYLLKKRG